MKLSCIYTIPITKICGNCAGRRCARANKLEIMTTATGVGTLVNQKNCTSNNQFTEHASTI